MRMKGMREYYMINKNSAVQHKIIISINIASL